MPPILSRRALLATAALSGPPLATGAKRRARANRAGGRASDADRPHVLLVVADDMRDSDWRAFPQTLALMDPRGCAYPGICENPVCAPARASLMTGKHSGNSGIRTAKDTGKGLRGSTIAPAMRQAGYQTALFGKYLNGTNSDPEPPGWDDFDTRSGNDIDSVRDRSLDWLKTHPDGPVFLYVAPIAPHGDYLFPRRHADAYPDEPEPERSRLRECLAVDDLVAALADRLDRQGRLDRTILIVVSDNGYHSLGEHGESGKGTPYAEALRVTVRAMGPGIPAGRRSGTLVCPQDIPVTVAALAGAELRGADGIDFTRASLPYRLIQSHARKDPWFGLAGPDWTYVEWGKDGTFSYFDRAADPAEETDAYPTLPQGQKDRLAAWLAEARAA